MHKISKENIQDLANQLASMVSSDDTSLLLKKVRELYEEIVLLHNYPISEEKAINKNSNTISNIDEDTQTSENDSTNLSIKERIQQIMDTAANIEVDSEPEIDLTETSKEEIVPPSPSEIKNKNMPTASLEEEFEDAISADYAADLFENVEKVEMTKKSLNDALSQKQIQIGLNDRIAFVKHLFNGNQGDFNRVLSQLNSFQTEVQAKNFINSIVKPDYNWENKMEYEERLTVLIERKFL